MQNSKWLDWDKKVLEYPGTLTDTTDKTPEKHKNETSVSFVSPPPGISQNLFGGFDGRGSGPFVIFHGPIRTGSDAPETKYLESIFESSTINSPWHIEPAAVKYPGWLMATNLETGSIVEWKKGAGDRTDRWTSATISGSIGGTYRVSTRIDGLCRTIVKLRG
jgi:hypothetical protein